MNLSNGLENLGSDAAGLFIVGLVVTLALMALWSSVTRTSPEHHLASLGPRAKGVFLSLRFRPLGEAAASAHTGHVTALTLGTATFVSPRFLGRGDEVELDLGTLPGFPAGGPKIRAKVLNARAMGGEPTSYLITVKLPALPEDDRRPLLGYIASLTGGNRLSHA